MVVQLGNINLPVDSILWTVFDCNWKVSTVVETSELAGSDHSASSGSSYWLLDLWGWLGLIGAKRLASFSFTLLEHYIQKWKLQKSNL